VTAKQSDLDSILIDPTAATAPQWERVAEDLDGTTARLAVAGGYLYRETWIDEERGGCGLALHFVPGAPAVPAIFPTDAQLANAMFSKAPMDAAAKAVGEVLESAGIFLASASKRAIAEAAVKAVMDTLESVGRAIAARGSL
jgi:hypothetical protein